MLLTTFQHLKRFGPKKELQLWSSGLLSWKYFECAKKNNNFSLFKETPEESELSPLYLSKKALAEEDVDFFCKKLAFQGILSHYP